MSVRQPGLAPSAGFYALTATKAHQYNADKDNGTITGSLTKLVPHPSKAASGSYSSNMLYQDSLQHVPLAIR